jgi:hypothetical protein
MTVKLNLSPETAAKVRQLADATGKDIEGIVLEALAEKLGEANSTPARARLSDQEWKDKLRALIDLHPVVTHFVDDSRESIYAGRGE